MIATVRPAPFQGWFIRSKIAGLQVAALEELAITRFHVGDRFAG